MKDPLQENHALLAIYGIDPDDGRAAPGIPEMLDMLIYCANRHEPLGDEYLREGLTANKRWVDRYYKYGKTRGLVKDLNAKLKAIQVSASMHFDYKSGEIEWNYAQKTDEFELPSIEESVAFHFALVLGSGELDRLRKCEMSDCRKYFIGTDRAMWCSNTCGSRNRARNKRKRDREAGNLASRYL